MNYNFDENEMPYGILERFGLTQTMIDDFADRCPPEHLQWPQVASPASSYHSR